MIYFNREWNCIYIPLLTIDQWDTLEAMMPFIIGINKIHYNSKIVLNLKFGPEMSEVSPFHNHSIV